MSQFLVLKEELLNADNPFKRQVHWVRIVCTICGEIVLNKGVATEWDWKRVQIHMEVRHDLAVSDGIPIGLLTPRLRMKEVHKIIHKTVTEARLMKLKREAAK